jgi:histidinol phosphatase-like PHP family hydrolase
LDLIGITDHYATKKIRSIIPEQLVSYTKHIKRLKHENRSKIKVLAGVELDSNPNRTDLENLNISQLNTLDFILFEYVADPLWGGIALDEFLILADKFSIPLGLAHPDIELCFYSQDLGEIISKLEGHNIFIELSTGMQNTRNGKQYYHLAQNFFEKIKDTKIGIAVGSDSHEDADDIINIYDAEMFIESMGLSENLNYFLKQMKLK